jgi:hypothetical protein
MNPSISQNFKQSLMAVFRLHIVQRFLKTASKTLQNVRYLHVRSFGSSRLCLHVNEQRSVGTATMLYAGRSRSRASIRNRSENAFFLHKAQTNSEAHAKDTRPPFPGGKADYPLPPSAEVKDRELHSTVRLKGVALKEEIRHVFSDLLLTNTEYEV